MIKKADNIELVDVGPNAKLSIPYLPDGGVVVLRGPNDSGKSEALRAVRRIAGADERLTRRDGAAGRGSVEGFGLTITVGASTRKVGECEAQSLEGELNLSDLIQPPVKDPAAADKTRIKAILALTGDKADPALFAPLVGGPDDLADLVSEEARTATDLVEMARMMKRDLEQAARRQEQTAETETGKAEGLRQAIEGVDLTAECDAGKLQAVLEAAVVNSTTLKNRADEVKRVLDSADAAAESLRRSKVANLGELWQDVERARAAESEADAVITAAMAAKADLQARLKAIERDIEAATAAKQAARSETMNREKIHEQAVEHAATVAAWEKQVNEAAGMSGPTPADLAEANQAVQKAREAVERGAVVRNGLDSQRKRESAQEAASCATKAAAWLRDAAHGTDAVLSEAVHADGITIKDGRLVTIKEGREVFFSDRSAGFRAAVAIDIALERVRRSGSPLPALLVLDQQLWESLDGKNRLRVIEHAKARKVTVYTAEASRDPNDPGHVRAEVAV